MWEYGVNQTYSLEKLGINPSEYDFPITVKANYITEKAKAKIQAAGGEAIKAE